MAANTTPIFPLIPVATVVAVATANTGRDGSGTIATIFNPNADGARLRSVRLQAIVATTAQVFRLWVRSSSAGTWYLYAEILIAAITPSTTIQAWGYEYVFQEGKPLSDGTHIGGSVNAAEQVNAHCNGGEYGP